VFLNQAVPAPAAASAAIAHPATIRATGEPDDVFLPAAKDGEAVGTGEAEVLGSVKTRPGPVDCPAELAGKATAVEDVGAALVAGAGAAGGALLVAAAGFVVLAGAGFVTGAGGGAGASLPAQIDAYDEAGGG
jgi:hypothetical protein